MRWSALLAAVLVAVSAAAAVRSTCSICASRRWSSSSRSRCVGLNLLMGFAGQVSLGHAGFFGIGAYAVAVGPTHLGVPSWAALIAGAAAAGAARLRWSAGRSCKLQRALPRRRDARHRHSHRDGVHQRGAPAPAGPTACRCRGSTLFGWSRARLVHLVLDFAASTLVIGAWLALNLIDSPTGRALPRHPRQRDRGRACSASTSRATSSTAFVLSAIYAAVAGSYLALFDGW